jgi:rod shape-determining protein MreC
VLLALCVVGIVYGRVQTTFRAQGRFDPLARILHFVSDPVARGAGGAADGIGDFCYGLFNARRLTAENRRMRDLLVAQSLYTVRTDQLDQEIDRERGLLSLPPYAGKTRVMADIVGYSPYENRLTVSAGSLDGVGVGMAVECDLGLVGTVQTVDKSRCQVQLLSSAGLTIGAVDIDRSPPSEGLLNGDSPSKLRLVFPDSQASVAVGDKIVTSGHSEHIPRGILIGKVIAVDFNPEFGDRRATVFPAVKVGQIREVAILK